ncbi:HAMP domain-containing protein [Massilia forsythiae]|uniref:HAMP domain-containing protein n=1 Tax=Massilia forsythiae TaxID=2728020 RepID=A0A7Z2VWF2_9BURK|nr:methyl-accepting chemotaxis protein [Massilia forsythiae]QJE00743.1 HAMP domain-containing protein [Massilia forsythiae]
MNLLNLNIANRLRLGFGLLVVLIAALAGVALNSLGRLHDGTTDLAKGVWPRVRLANLALDNIRGSMGRVGQLVAANDAAARAEANERLAINVDGINKALISLEPLLVTPAGKALMVESKQQRDIYLDEMTRVRALVAEGKVEEANALAFGKMYASLQTFAQSMRKQVDFQQDRFDKLAGEADAVHATAVRVIGGAATLAVLLAAAAALVITRSVVRPLGRAVEVARTVAGGDLTSRIEVAGSDEAAQMMRALHEMNASLCKVVAEVRTGSGEIATAAREIATGNLELSARTEQQAGALEETASSMEQMTATVRQNAENARQANQLAASATAVARQGGDVVAQVVRTMGDIDAASRKIVEIIAVIDGIAFQTNILALNAAVEAARAGEQGRGFAVVATEVRALAQRSASAAKEVKALIDDSVGKVGLGSQLVGQAGGTMAQVVDSVQRVSDIMAEISSASHEQEAGITQINGAVTDMDAVTQQNAALVEEAAGAAGSLQEQADRLARMVAVFKVEGAQAGAETVTRTLPAQQPPKPRMQLA